MNSYTFTDGALLALLISPAALLFVTAHLRSRRQGVAADGPSVVPGQPQPASVDELSKPLIAMQEQVDLISRAYSELSDGDAASDRMSELEAEVNEAAAWIADLLSDRDRRLASENRLRDRLATMTTELERLRVERDAVIQKSQALSAELASTRNDVGRLTEMLERSEMEKRALQDELGTLAPRLAELLGLLKDLTVERDHLRRQLAVAQGTLSQHHRATVAAENVLEQALQGAPIEEVRGVEVDLRNLRSMESDRSNRVTSLTDRLASLDLETSAVRERLAVGRPVFERLQSQLAGTKANAGEINQALSNARHRIERLHRSTRPRNG